MYHLHSKFPISAPSPGPNVQPEITSNSGNSSSSLKCVVIPKIQTFIFVLYLCQTIIRNPNLLESLTGWIWKIPRNSNEIIAQTRDDFVKKVSEKERANGRLVFRRVKELSEDADYAEALRRAKGKGKMGRLWDIFRDAVVFLCYCDEADSSQSFISYSTTYCCVRLFIKVLWQVFSVLEGLSLEVFAYMRS
ncbi:uncharacterized protein EAF01_010845 [Botrytis porri]|uniref:uncharacterized protein n=1 Tax=Botrytis porri TaxID=87229 RepID=UPI0018FF85F5|nr:uncharacterized protein EAF01_010845 [Botrytis porri]KAF7889352.1 hypothetical protein EAF01_010845 [Botrytis porri]